MELKQHLEQLSTRTKLFESNWRVTKNIMDSQEIMLELMLKKYWIETIPRGAAREIIMHTYWLKNLFYYADQIQGIWAIL